LVTMVLFTIGFCTKITAVLSWMGMMCYIQRLPTVLFGMDTINNILMLYLIIGPSGQALSVDRLLARWWARRQGRVLGPVQPSEMANFAIRLMQVHFCFIYMASGLSKLLGSAWWNGTAIWSTVANYAFAPMNWPVYTEGLRFLSQHRWMWELAM